LPIASKNEQATRIETCFAKIIARCFRENDEILFLLLQYEVSTDFKRQREPNESEKETVLRELKAKQT
jgi:hypothetical protein